MTTTRPDVKNIHNLVVGIYVVPNPVFPESKAEPLEAKLTASVESQLTTEGFAIVEASEAGIHAPELTFWIEVLSNERYPALAVLHLSLILRDWVTVKNRRFRSRGELLALWDCWDSSGETLLVERTEVAEVIENWVREGTAAFVSAVRDQAKLSGNANISK